MMILKYMCMIFVLMLDGFAAADKLVHPEPRRDIWDAYFRSDHQENKLSNNADNEECTQLFDAVNTKPYPKYSKKNLESADCEASPYADGSDKPIKVFTNTDLPTKLVVCNCNVTDAWNNPANEMIWYVVSNEKKAYYVITNYGDNLWTIGGYWLSVSDDSNLKSKFS